MRIAGVQSIYRSDRVTLPAVRLSALARSISTRLVGLGRLFLHVKRFVHVRHILDTQKNVQIRRTSAFIGIIRPKKMSRSVSELGIYLLRFVEDLRFI